MDAADGRLVAGAVEWIVGEVLLDVRINVRLISDRRRTGGHLAVWGMADVRDAAVVGMLRRTAGKSARYAGVPDPLDVVRRHLPL